MPKGRPDKESELGRNKSYVPQHTDPEIIAFHEHPSLRKDLLLVELLPWVAADVLCVKLLQP